MSMSVPSCPKCGASMEAGAVVESYGDGRHLPLVWLETDRVRAARAAVHPRLEGFVAETKRCSGCGYLEFWATQPGSVERRLEQL